MANAITKSFSIKVLSTNTTYDSLTDMEWALNNPNSCIGQPVRQSDVVTIPFGRQYDSTEKVYGQPYYIGRVLTMKCGVKNSNLLTYQSTIRNLFDGQRVQIIFSDDLTYYWEGIVSIQNYETKRNLATFDFVVDADAYKYSTTLTTHTLSISPPLTQVFTASEQPTPVFFDGSVDTDTNIQWTANGKTYNYVIKGNTYMSDFEIPFMFNGPLTSQFTITSGSWTEPLTVKYRVRSL